MNNRKRMRRRALRMTFRKYKYMRIYELIRNHEHISPLIKMGRMNGRHDGFRVLFATVDEITQYCPIEEAKRFYGL